MPDSVFPTSIDTFVNPVSTSSTTTVDHSLQHRMANDALAALEARVGVTSSAVTSSLTYRIAQLEAGSLFTGARTSYTPTWGSTGTAPAVGNGTIDGEYRKVGRELDFAIYLVMGSTTTYGTGAYTFTLPASNVGTSTIAYQTVTASLYDASTGNTYALPTFIAASAGVVQLFVNGSTGMTGTNPVTLATGDFLSITGRISTNT